MPKHKDLKRRIRARMQKTGESYTAARARILQKKGAQPPAKVASPALEKDLAALAGMSDDAVQAKTSRTWKQWVAELDRVGARSLAHRDIARKLHEDFDVPVWWAQMVTVGYERITGLREKGQRRGGGYDVSKSKTYPVPIGELFAAFGAGPRKRWLTDAKLTLRKATPRKSMRFACDDGTRIEMNFWSKGERKSQVQLQQGRLPDRAGADRLRSRWTVRLEALGEFLAARREAGR